MLDKIVQHNDWKSKYQVALAELEERQREWMKIEELLRKAIGRLSIAGRGLDPKLDKQLRIIQDLSREKRDDQLAGALGKLSSIITALDDNQASGKQRRSDPILLMLELLQDIHFNPSQRERLREICSDLLKSVASGHDRESVSVYIKKLSALINENFDNVGDDRSSAIVLQLLRMLSLDETANRQIEEQFAPLDSFETRELTSLAALLNRQLNPDGGRSSINEVITTLLERLAIIQGAHGSAQDIQTRVHDGIAKEEWADTLNDILNSISDSLKKLDREKRELENFILRLTDQLGDITQFVTEGRKDHQSDYEETNSLHDFVEEGMNLIQNSFQAAEDLKQLKSEISRNIDQIRGGVDDFVTRFNHRHEATEKRNLLLAEQLSQMEQETHELHVMLMENREKLLYDALTGVYSRMAYEEGIEQELARWARYQTPLGYVIIDIDHFKRINDDYGHNAGDKALRIVAQMMQQYVRKSDYVYRIGGEEFVLLLTNTSAEKSAVMVDELRRGVGASEFHFKGERVHLTLSAGITETRSGDSIESIYERADAALYKAKNAGRNCQVIAE